MLEPDGRESTEPRMNTDSPSSPPREAAAAAPALFQVIAAWVALCLIWSSTWLVIKVGLAELPPLWFVALRFVVATAILFAVCAGRYPIFPRDRREYFFLAGTGLLVFTVNYALLFWAEQHISSGLAAVLQATIPIFGLLFAHLHLPGERLHWAKLFGAALGVAGVAIICGKVLDVQGSLAFRGGLGVIVGAAAAAYSNTWSKMRGGRFAPAVLAAWQMLFGCVPLLGLAFWLEGSPFRLHWDTSAVACLLYLALVGSAVAFLLYYWLLRRIAVTRLQTISLITPPLALVVGWFLAGEELSPWAILGAAFILVGMGLIFWKTQARVVPVLVPVPAAAGDVV